MTPLTDQKLGEMKERASKAEPGDLVFIVISKKDVPLLITEIDRQRKEIEELKKDKARLATLRSLMGHYQNGTDATVKLFTDDATFTYHVTSGKKEFWGDSFNEAIDKAALSLTAESEGEK